MKQPRGGMTSLFMVGGMVLCCALPLIILGGGLAGAGTWLLGGGWLAIAAVISVVSAGLYLRRRRGAPGRSGETR